MTKKKEQLYIQCINYYRKSAEAYHRGDTAHGYAMYRKAKDIIDKLAELTEKEG